MNRGIRDIIIHTCACIVAFCLIITVLPVYAVPSGTTQENNNGAQGDADSDGTGSSADQASEESEGAFTTSDWLESEVTGSDTPTLKAKKPADFSSNYSGGQPAEEHLYTMTVSTGIKAGTNSVVYFAIRYKDVNGASQTKYILMSNDPLKESYEYMNSKGGENNELKERHEKLEQLNYNIKEPNNREPLSAWSVDEFLFMTETDIATVTDVDIFMSNGSWAVQGLVISKVTSVSGYGESGFYSGNYFFGIGKQRLCQLEKKKKSLTLSADKDVLLQLAGGNSIYASLKKLDGKDKDPSPFQDMFTFRMDFADTLDGGIESYLKSSASDGSPVPAGFVEHLALEIEYMDKNGWTRSVTMPVMLSVLGQYLTSKDTVNTMGLAQRGETIAFTGYLPEYSSLLTTRLYTGAEARSKLESTGGITAKSNDMAPKLDSDNISIAGISIYKGTCRLSNTEDGTDSLTGKTLESYTTAYSFSESNPDYYYTTNSEGGRSLVAGTQIDVNMKTYNPKDPLIAVKYKGNFLVRLRTDASATEAGTKGDVTTKISYYSAADKDSTAGGFNAKTLAKEYMGYWPSAAGIDSDFAYDYGMKPGNYVEFLIDVDDVAALTGVDVSLAADADEYQMSGISICTVDNIERRRIYKQDTTGNGDSSTYRIVRTSTNAPVSPFPIEFKEPQLLTGGDYKSFGLQGGGSAFGGLSLNDVFESNRYSMTYEQTKQDLGFISSGKSFDVAVYVADDASTSNANGDSGSENKFFFQLQFANGNSAVVLANQQLSSDGFRAGYQEIFTITTNRDYGALKSVRIMPEDTNSDNDVFDKLNIRMMTVTEKSNGGAAMQYIFDNVGWVGIDYHDSAEAGSVRGRAGRSMGELSTRYMVSSQRQVVSLLCEVSTLPSEIKDELPNQASVSCNLNYIDTDDQPQTISFDIIARMAEYMNMTAKTYEAPTDGSRATYYENMGGISDPKWMLRPNHTDRFILPAIPNLKTVKSMEIAGTNRNNGTTHWVIGGISLSEVLEDGTLQLTSDDEYYRNLSTSPLCKMVSPREKETLTLPTGTKQSITVNFSENELVWKAGESWVTPVTRMPEAESDSVNVFVYPTAGSRNIDNVNLKLAVQYALPFSQVMQTTQNNLRKSGSGTADAMFYTTGLSVKGMERLVSLSLRCVNSNMLFDHAMVQHVREGVVISNYYVPLLGASAVLGLTARADDTNAVTDSRMQTLYMSVSPDTKESTLFAEENDIAVSFKYKSSVDNNEGEYYSPYVYLTDAGYKKIRPGQMLEIPFEVPYVSEITGYRIVSFGALEGAVDAAAIVNYSFSERKIDEESGEITYEDKKREGVYCFNRSNAFTNSVVETGAPGYGFTGENTLNLLDLTFNTSEATSTDESGTDEQVSMIFNYKDHMDRERSRTIQDIRPFIQSDEQQFETGGSSRVMLFLPECSELISIDILLSGGQGNEGWMIDSINGSLGLGDTKINRSVNKTFSATESTTISLKSIKLNTTITYGPSEGTRKSASVTDHVASVVLNSGDVAYISPTIEGGGGYTAQAVWIVDGVESDVTSDTLKRGNGNITFTAPQNDTTNAQIYSVIIRSSLNSDVCDTINITVPPRNAASSSEAANGSSSQAESSSDGVSSDEGAKSSSESSSE